MSAAVMLLYPRSVTHRLAACLVRQCVNWRLVVLPLALFVTVCVSHHQPRMLWPSWLLSVASVLQTSDGSAPPFSARMRASYYIGRPRASVLVPRGWFTRLNRCIHTRLKRWLKRWLITTRTGQKSGPYLSETRALSLESAPVQLLVRDRCRRYTLSWFGLLPCAWATTMCLFHCHLNVPLPCACATAMCLGPLPCGCCHCHVL
jgi:hypothetical protein